MRELTQCAKDLLEVVEYRGGHAKNAYMIENEIKQRFGRTYKVEDYTNALEILSKENANNGDDFLLNINGWFVKMTLKIVQVSKDDLDWYFGTGYYSQ